MDTKQIKISKRKQEEPVEIKPIKERVNKVRISFTLINSSY